MKRLLAFIVLLVLLGGVFFVEASGYLVVNNLQKSNVIVVLAGDEADDRYYRGLQLLKQGYGQHMLLDATTTVTYGHSYTELAADLVTRTAGAEASRIIVCPINGDSTKDESADVGACLKTLQPPPHTGLIVTDNYHTRRALSIFSNRLPEYHWTAAAADNPYLYGTPWWKHREWAKTYLTEWQKLIWWQLFDRWRS
jgi:uncharacterized SAM-binding protein YcdF (DUF218 family)